MYSPVLVKRNTRALVWVWMIAALMAGAVASFGQAAVIAKLGCANCHSDLPFKSELRGLTPDLSSAGLRYDSGWLFEFLRKPVRVKRHLGMARMPDFHLSDSEAVALIAFLETQKVASESQREIPDAIRKGIAEVTPVTAAEFHRTITNGLICLSCHTFDGKGGNQGIELGSVSYRLRREWVKEYLVAPSRFGVAHGTMPAQFFDPTNQFRELVPNAAQRIQTIAGYLFSLNAEKRKALQVNYEAAKGTYPNADAELGRKIFVSQNCAGCHRHHSIQPREQAAPELTKEAARVRKGWLETFLIRPYAIRPFGYQPGDGSRMPDFGLSTEEIGQIVSALGVQQRADAKPASMSAFAKRKAKSLLTEKLSCFGCHRFGEAGGRIGPDLAYVRERLQPEYVRNMVRNPRETNPHTIMPQVPMPEETLKLIANLLLHSDEKPMESRYLSLTDNALLSGTNNYAKYCAGCHGEDGRGNGFNAAFLPQKRTAHANAADMSRRPDDTLFDAIHSGGYIVNRSRLMPPWGESFSAKEIRDLVAHIRTLCRCEGPGWSRDNAK
ncbi:MAG TPA: c-type cytochrome [Verrucomicrobiae bacterium]|nr:c-type cytochrome [Verrucomicrobiae bacterium]